jgi:hypothetical protein
MAHNDRLPIIPRLEDPASASADERDEHLMLLEAARQELDVQWTSTLAAADTAGDHALMPPPAENDSRTTSQRRADALEDPARRFLDRSESSFVGGEDPT